MKIAFMEDGKVGNTYDLGEKAKHTAGPWTIGPCHGKDQFKLWYVNGPEKETDEWPVRICELPMRYSTMEEQKANARLIAACPMLLEAAKEVLDIINAYSHIPAQFKACEILQTAIARAEGR